VVLTRHTNGSFIFLLLSELRLFLLIEDRLLAPYEVPMVLEVTPYDFELLPKEECT